MGKHSKRKRNQPYELWSTAVNANHYHEPDEAARCEIERVFSKDFTYPLVDPLDFDNDQFVSSLFSEARWYDPKLQQLKSNLNDVKSLLSALDITEWHQHTTQTHPGGQVTNHMRRYMNGEMCTQAWCKFREIIERLELVSCPRDIHSLHLCEAPGSFITSLNHYLLNNRFSSRWSWVAMTLNPYYEGNSLSAMIDDDQFIYETLDHWYFGCDDTGNIMSSANITGLIDVSNNCGCVNLVTADGSIDCANSPGEQETITSMIHYSELVAALHVLHPGGHFILKMFTLFEDSSVGLIYILRSAFDKLRVFKPMTSKPGNSEVYVIAQGYKGLPSVVLNRLLSHVDSSSDCDKSILPQSIISEEFLESHRECCEKFTQFQTDTIMNNLRLFENKDTLPERLEDFKTLKHYCVQDYIQKYAVLPIDQQEWIVPKYDQSGMSFKSSNRHHSKMYRHKGSYVARQQQLHLQWNERVMQIQMFPTSSSAKLPWIQNDVSIGEDDIKEWQPITGQGFSCVQTSRFCDNKLLQTYSDVLENAKVSLKVQNGLCSESEADLSMISLSQEPQISDYTDFIMKSAELFLPFLENQYIEVSGINPDDVLCDILQKHVDKSSIEERVCSPKGPKLITLNCYDLHTTELTWCSSIHTLSTLVHTLQAQTIGAADDLIIALPPLLTRINAAVVFICRQCFHKVTLVIPEKASYPVCFLVAIGYKSISTHLMSYLADSIKSSQHGKISKATSAQGSHGNQLLGIVPIQCLYDGDLFDLLWEANTVYIHHRLNYIITMEKETLQA